MDSDTDSFPTLTGYQFRRQIGRGGMGTVYLAWDETLGRQVAIKVLSEKIEAGSAEEARFHREARLMATIDHPNVVRIHHLASEQDRAFIVMEYVEGESLAARLRARRRLPLPEALAIARQVVKALAAAWEKGIVHRDVKPSNILIDRDERVRVADFGLAKPIMDSDCAVLTGPEALLGTVYYLSPEQTRNEGVDWRSDLYSLGVVLYQMLTGVRPFRGSVVNVIRGHLEEPPPPLAEQAPDLPPGVEDLVAWLLDKDPDRRPGSSQELLVCLDALIAGASRLAAGLAAEVGETRAAAPPLSARRPGNLRLRPSVLAPIALMAALALAGWIFRSTLNRGVTIRKSVAVLGFWSLNKPEINGWKSTALSELLGAELATGDRLRLITGETVARFRDDFKLIGSETLADDTLALARSRLGADYVIVGSYLVDQRDPPHLRLMVNLQDTRSRETLTEATTGPTDRMMVLVTPIAAWVRQKLGVVEPPPEMLGQSAAGLPSDPEALYLYAEGLRRLHSFDFVAARDHLERAVAAEPERALPHAALAEAWSALGYDAKAQEQAQRARDLAADLPLRDLTLITGRYFEISRRWEEAIEQYETLFGYFPDEVEVGLRLARALTEAGRGEEAFDVVNRLRKLPSPSSDDLRIDLAEAAAAERISDYHRARDVSRRAVTKAEDTGARLHAARGRLHLGLATLRLDGPALARVILEDAQDLFEAVGDRSSEARAVSRIAQAAYEQGHFEQARGDFEKALALWRTVGNRQGIAQALNNIASTLAMQGRLADAKGYTERGLEVVEEVGDQKVKTALQLSLADLELHLGDLDAAEARARQGHATARAGNFRDGICGSFYMLGKAALSRGDLVSARSHFEDGLAIASELGDHLLRSKLLFYLGYLAMVADDLDLADQRHREALAIREELGFLVEAAECQVALARLGLAQGKPTEWDKLLEAAAFYRKRSLPNREAYASAVQAAAALAEGKMAEARQAIGRAEELLPQCEDVPVRLLTTVQIARTLAANGDVATAREHLTAAIAAAAERGFALVTFQARLAEAEIEKAVSGRPPGTLEDLAAEAEGLGLKLVARKAIELGTPAS